MTELMGLDIAWARPTAQQILATGAHFVARYFSTDSTKDLQAPEVPAYTAVGLSIVTVWETTATRATAGHAAGVADAQAAEAKRKAVGLPGDHVLYFAVDQDTSWASVVAYIDGVISVLGIDRVGVYGSFQIIEAAYAHGIRYLWQTSAWSGGQWSAHASIRQTGGTALSAQADLDFAATADYGQYPRPAITPVPLSKEDDMAAYEKDIKPGFGADQTGKVIDDTKATVIAIPPQQGTEWGGVFVSFGCDFGDVHLRVAVLGATGTWRVTTINPKSAGPRLNVPIQDGDAKISVMRMRASATDKADSIPTSALVEAFHK